LTATIVLPGEGSTLDNPETDTGIQLTGSSGAMIKASAGDVMNVAVPFDAPNRNVVAAGVGERG
jgi:hypothetical protein